MCGGALEINNETVATCEYCGTTQTLPRIDDERKANLYDRANHFRRNNEFDKAMGIYEQILNDDNTDSEAYWALVLCSYGIEYVEDPATHKRVPTVNRAQYTSVFDDDNYKSALQYADSFQKSIYEQEAAAINEIQKEEPFDVFICYKETDNSGRRTPDSVLANDLYHQLTQEGFKVFFARITLEDKLGSAYEPYIFAALNSAKVMVALGTKPEYFNAVWVKNEWSRYLSLIKNGAKKMLIPAYKDIPGWKDADEQIIECRRLIEEMEAEIEAKREANRLEWARLHEIELKKSEKRKRIATLSAVIIGIIGVFLFILIEYIIPNERYNNAIALMEEEKYGEAYEIFVELDDFEDSELYAHYAEGLMLVEEGKYGEAYEIFVELDDFEDSELYAHYAEGLMLVEEGRYERAYEKFSGLDNFKDSSILTKYTYARWLMEERKYEEAMTLFESLGSYGDSADRLELLKLYDKISSLQVGSSITLGSYNGESIVWTVLEREDDKLLVISRDVLENRSYSSHTSNTSWGLSGVRSWLNNEFLKTAFSNYETEIILFGDIKGSYSTVRDRIFLLSDEEAEKYFDSNNERRCESGGLWLLRDGDYVRSGYIVNNDKPITGGVRPAMWIAPNPSN